MNKPNLPPGFTLRPAAQSDVEPVCAMIRAALKAGGDENLAPSAPELAQDWQAPDFTLETDAWVITAPDGLVVGYEEMVNRFAHAALRGDGYVHPGYLNLGIGTSLLATAVQRARQEVPLAKPDLRVFLRNAASSKEPNALEVHTAAGFSPIRYTWQMLIQPESAPEPVQWPGNIELRPFDLERHNHQVYEADEEAFLDHWGHTPDTYETWLNHVSGHPDFNPSLWFIAWDGDQVAGYSLCRPRQGWGWVGTLGVRRPWRKQGLGMALLKHSFGQLYQRGYTSIGLMVDASSPTGATRLYERAGMHITSQFVTYELELRPGREPQE